MKAGLMRVGSPRQVGLVGLVALVALALLVGALSIASFGQRSYTAELEHTAGLRVGEEVQVAGVGVGEVTAIRLSEEVVEVDFTVDRDVTLGRETTAAVKVATLLGSHFLEVAPRGSGTLDDDTIAVAATTVPYNLQDVVDGAAEALGELDEDRLAESMTVLADVLERTPEETAAAVEGVAELTEVASRRSEQLRRLMRATSDVSSLLVRNKDSILNLLEQSTLVLAELTSRKEVIDAMLTDSRTMAEQVTGLLRDSEEDLKPLMRDLTASLDSLEDSRDDIMTAMSDLGTMTRYVANASGNGPWLDLNVPVALNDNLTCVRGEPECQ
ncbi:MCE family protein [Aeromicrobium sp. CTD01-1L150]|uniref:MCE family protein n=1 Tax=Aeromicrobium sp. CTD01-1L150 TaxID=3341830 RepID=UPI0035C091E3